MNDVVKGHTVTNSLAEHADNTGNEISLDNTLIVVTKKNLTTWLNLKSLIIQTSNTISRSSGTLNQVYSQILHYALTAT